VRRARQEHDAFADALADRGVEVLYLHELLAHTLEIPEARTEVVKATLDLAALGRQLGPELQGWLASLGSAQLARLLIGGVAQEDLPFHSRSLTVQVGQEGGFVLPPLPNHLFTRDPSAWIYGGVTVNAMAKSARPPRAPASAGDLQLASGVRRGRPPGLERGRGRPDRTRGR
jgi:arginine deiminase